MAATSLAVAAGLAAAPSASASASLALTGPAAGTSRATYIGAFAGKPGANPATVWNTAYHQVGPLQSDKIFYGTGTPKPLPPSFTGTVCAPPQRGHSQPAVPAA